MLLPQTCYQLTSSCHVSTAQLPLTASPAGGRHSMGGRVAMRVAAEEAGRLAREPSATPLLAACVIEDMDCAVHQDWTPSPDSALSNEQRASLHDWAGDDGRRFGSWERCRDALLAWYDDPKRVESWRGEALSRVATLRSVVVPIAAC